MPDRKLKLVFYVSDAETGKVFDWQQVVMEFGDSNADHRAACEAKADKMLERVRQEAGLTSDADIPPSMAFAIESTRIQWFKEICQAAGVVMSKFMIVRLRGHLAQAGLLPPTPEHDRMAAVAQQHVAEKSSDEDIFELPKEGTKDA